MIRSHRTSIWLFFFIGIASHATEPSPTLKFSVFQNDQDLALADFSDLIKDRFALDTATISSQETEEIGYAVSDTIPFHKTISFEVAAMYAGQTATHVLTANDEHFKIVNWQAAVQAGLAASWPIKWWLAPYARAGATYWRSRHHLADLTVSDNQTVGKLLRGDRRIVEEGNEFGVDPYIGLGLQFNLNRDWGLDLGWQQTNLYASKATMISFGLTFTY